MTRCTLLLIPAVLLAAACGGPPPANTDPDAGSNETLPDAGGNSDGGCTPKTCADMAGCGTYDDGCGGQLTCTDTCQCDETNFDEVCPQKPCQTLAGCQAGQCVYVPVTCGGETCAPADCQGDGCDLVCTTATCEDRLYPCGNGVCANISQYCDPSPSVMNGKVVYQNACVFAPKSGCGTCGLGLRSCDGATDRWACANIPVPVLSEGGMVECNDTVVASTFLYVDANFVDGVPTGSREAPYPTYAQALAAAETRNARGIVIAGSPVFTTPLVVKNGISVYGGYDGYPTFNPNPAQRPSWEIGPEHIANNQLTGGTAIDITTGTVLRHLSVKTAPVSTVNDGKNGASNIALLVRNADGLQIEDVQLEAGAAAPGVDGADGAPTTSAHNGGNAQGRNPGAAPPACAKPCTVSTAPPENGSNACGVGGLNYSNVNQNGAYTGYPGNDGSLTPLVKGGLEGDDYTGSDCTTGPSQVTPGQPGQPGQAGKTGANGQNGATGALSLQGIWTPGPGTDGEPGGPGTWGGGGGAGGAYENTASCAGGFVKEGGPGGGGGAPGCGGDFGRGGGGGGASIALAVVNSPRVIVNASELQASAAGNGGRGGLGRPGGAAGSGEKSNALLCPQNYLGNPSHEGKCGGAGGDGGAGGSGGRGGGGSGGSSIALLCVSSSVTPTETTMRTGSAGNGGEGPTPAPAGVSAETMGCEQP